MLQVIITDNFRRLYVPYIEDFIPDSGLDIKLFPLDIGKEDLLLCTQITQAQIIIAKVKHIEIRPSECGFRIDSRHFRQIVGPMELNIRICTDLSREVIDMTVQLMGIEAKIQED